MTRRTKANRSRALVAALAIGVAAMIALPADGSVSADRGDLDTTFGGTGQVAAGPTTPAEQGYEVAVDQTTGRVFVAAIETVFPAGMPQVFVAAFTSDGVLDTSFGVG